MWGRGRVSAYEFQPMNYGHLVHNNLFLLPQANLEVKYWGLYIICFVFFFKRSYWIFPKHPIFPALANRSKERKLMFIMLTRYQALCCVLSFSRTTPTQLKRLHSGITSSMNSFRDIIFHHRVGPSLLCTPLCPLTLPLWILVTYLGVHFCPSSRPAVQDGRASGNQHAC